MRLDDNGVGSRICDTREVLVGVADELGEAPRLHRRTAGNGLVSRFARMSIHVVRNCADHAGMLNKRGFFLEKF